MKRKILILLGTILLSSTIYAQNINIQNGWQLLGAAEDINVSKFDNSCVDYLWKYDNGNWQVHIANGQNYNYAGLTISLLNQGDGFWVKGNHICNIQTNVLMKPLIKFGDMNISVNQNNEFNVNLPSNSDILDLILFNTLSLDLNDFNISNGAVDFKIIMTNNIGDKLKLTVSYEKNGTRFLINSGSGAVVQSQSIPFITTLNSTIVENNNTLKFTPKYFLDYTDSNSYYARLIKSTLGFFFSSDNNKYNILIQVNDINITGQINIEN